MKPELRIILALSFSLAACGHSKPDLFLEQTTTALECGSASALECVPAADAGAPHPGVDECYGDGDCEYGEVCERRHGVSQCKPDGDGHGDDGHGDDDSSSDDDGYGEDDSSSDDDGHGGYDDVPDGGSPACESGYATDDDRKASDDCYPKSGYEDRSGSNSGPH